MPARISPQLSSSKTCDWCCETKDTAVVFVDNSEVRVCPSCVWDIICSNDSDISNAEIGVNRCDECDSEPRVLCQDCASNEWEKECNECGRSATVCDFHTECSECSNLATKCDDCASGENECSQCSDAAEYCASCAQSEFGRVCENCSSEYPSYCESCAKPECSVCLHEVAHEDVVCPNCKKSKVADGVVTFDPNQSYRIHYNEEA
jgi:hypothetical protein